jgi:hypothetical protein
VDGIECCHYADRFADHSLSQGAFQIPYILLHQLTSPQNQGIRYFGIFLGVSGCNGNLPTIIAFQANNVISNSRRSVANGVQFFFAAIGGIYASCTFMQKEYPNYPTGVWCAVATQFLLLLLCGIMTLFFRKQNKNANEGRAAIQGDASFRYTF